MKMKHLNAVIDIKRELKEAQKHHDKFNVMLMNPGDCQVEITVTCKQLYGPDLVADGMFLMSHSPAAREQVANSARHYWGKVVDLRAKLRSLGVEL